MKKQFPFVSIIIPCFEERDYIVQFLNSLISQDYPCTNTEVIIADGNSRDGTREEIIKFLNNYEHIRIIDNPDRNQTLGLLKAFTESRGEIIIRLDIHALYPPNYVSTLVTELQRLNAWNVGCPWKTTPSRNTLESFVIASALSLPFGVGNSHYRVGNTRIKEVDTVPFGCFPRFVLEKIGFYNKEFLKNEDEEFNFRITKAGGRIFLLPSPVITYFARETRVKLFKMLYQYGYFKPKVNFSVGSLITLRQLAPPLFVIYLILIPVIVSIGFIWLKELFLFIIPFAVYIFLIVKYSLKIALNNEHAYENKKVFLAGIITFCGMHFSYGAGYLSGLKNLLLRKDLRSYRTIESTR
jgi:glycosyltransferase involved in cell wall biosynthesis